SILVGGFSARAAVPDARPGRDDVRVSLRGAAAASRASAMPRLLSALLPRLRPAATSPRASPSFLRLSSAAVCCGGLLCSMDAAG
uniref:Uncharacterized protein n=1 Tax=Triticum urartu TaxID=4572 RepID=A0A8R7PU89_TRIUA